jgi:hypothetical protein
MYEYMMQACMIVSTWRDRGAGDASAAARPASVSRKPDQRSATARANVREREVLIGERIAAACEELGLRYLRVDGSLDLDDSLLLLEEQFRPYLPATPNA